MLHIDEFNRYKEDWCSLLSPDYQIIEWSYKKDKYHINLFYPEIDIELFPATAIRVFAGLAKLYDYGGISIIGTETKPPHNIVKIKQDHEVKSLSLFNMNPNILLSPAKDPVCLKYLSLIKDKMLEGVWKNVQYLDDVNAI